MLIYKKYFNNSRTGSMYMTFNWRDLLFSVHCQSYLHFKVQITDCNVQIIKAS